MVNKVRDEARKIDGPKPDKVLRATLRTFGFILEAI